MVIFDPDTIEDRATFQQPDLPPVGIDYVLMGGEIACDHGTIVNGTLARRSFGSKQAAKKSGNTKMRFLILLYFLWGVPFFRNPTFFPLYHTTKSRHPHFCECPTSFYRCQSFSLQRFCFFV